MSDAAENSADDQVDVLWEDGERSIARWRARDGDEPSRLVVTVVEPAPPEAIARLVHEYALRDDLDPGFAATPTDFVRGHGRAMLVLADHGGVPLASNVGKPLPLSRFLDRAIGIATAVAQMHARGLTHRNLKPGNILVGAADEPVRLTGFGLATRVPRERTTPVPPGAIAGTLAYMAPEQTGRMNRSIDGRSDLYALGMIFYEMLAGALPFDASDPMDWIHAHIAVMPQPLAARVPGVPQIVSDIVSKLLAKSADERYQSAAGLIADLARCAEDVAAGAPPGPFALGVRDVPATLVLRETLYGREKDVARLNRAFERVRETGAVGLVLVSGYSGIGKSSLVNELHRALVPARGLFATGKFDQYSHGVPYAPLAHALQTLVRQILATDEATLAEWRAALLEALGGHSQLLIGLVPELQLLIGEQPPVPALSGPEAQARFRSALLHFVGVFARPEHPLVLFLDDLQWLDTGTLDIFEALVTDPGKRSLLLIGAYRDNEVAPTHPLARRLAGMRSTVTSFEEIVLRGIGEREVALMLADALRAEPEAVEPLARVVAGKTDGNPFFAIQFILSLADRRLLKHDPDAARWQWDMERVKGRHIADNIVDLVVDRLSQTPAPALKLLGELACLGNAAEAGWLSLATGRSREDLERLLREPLRAGLLLRVGDAYAFAHDRVHEAAYAMLGADERATLHREIGIRLTAALDPAELDEQVFEIVGQLNRARLDAALSPNAATLNLAAGRRARAAAAYIAACNYLAMGIAQLGENAWATRYPLAWSLALEHAECTFLKGDFEDTARLVDALLRRAATDIDMADAVRLQIELAVVRSDNEAAVASALTALERFAIVLDPHPGPDAVDAAYRDVWEAYGDRPIACFAELPEMTDTRALASIRLLAELWAPAFFTDFNLTVVVTCRMVELSLAHGIAPASTQGFAWMGWLLGPAFGRYDDGLAMTRLAHEVAERRTTLLDASRILQALGLTETWTQPLPKAVDTFRTSAELGIEVGDVYFACYAYAHMLLYRLMMGEDLRSLHEECVGSREFARKVGFAGGLGIILATERAVASLRGCTAGLGDYDGDGFDQAAFEEGLESSGLAVVVAWYWTRRTLLLVLAGDHGGAIAAADRAYPNPRLNILHVQNADYHTYRGVALAMACDARPPAERGALLRQIRSHHDQLATWAAETGSATFADRPILLRAELARLEGDEPGAQGHYEHAITTARQHGFVQNEGLASERAATFYAARGLKIAANAYWRAAHGAFLRWGAVAKVSELEARHPWLKERVAPRDVTSTTVAPLASIELATVVKIAQAVSGELVLDRLVEALMRIALEHAGADRGALLLWSDGELGVEAVASARPDGGMVRVEGGTTRQSAVPMSVINTVARTREAVIVEDAAAPGPFAADPYFAAGGPRSILCMPLTHPEEVKGVLYLENSLAPGVFTAERITILKLVASQAAISIDNTRLYRAVEERESRIRRLVDSDVIGIVIWDLDGTLIDANDAFLRMLQYEREEVAAGLNWLAMTPPDWQEVHAREEAAELAATGRMQAREKEYYRKDGSRVPVLIGATTFEGDSRQGVAFVLDLTERRAAEVSAQESNRRVRALEAELAHANRIAMMNQLSAWISHDVRQPLVGVVASANAGLNWLDASPPNVMAAQRALERVVRDGHRAAAVLDRARGLFDKAPPRREPVDINVLIRETVMLTAADSAQEGIAIRINLQDNLPPVVADRIQLQQVVLNLIVNAFDAMRAVTDMVRELDIETRGDPSGMIEVAISDTGPGLSSDTAERVFDAFYTTKAGGMGMGLAISRTIIETLGGQIWVSAERSRGTTFRFLLVANAAASSAPDNGTP